MKTHTGKEVFDLLVEFAPYVKYETKELSGMKWEDIVEDWLDNK
jgi:hypothetical protein